MEIDPRADVTWITHAFAESADLLREEDRRYLGLPPEPQEAARPEDRSRLLVDSTVDRPWSQYFCCMAAANRDFVRKNPVATKRALRAILKAADLRAAVRAQRGASWRRATARVPYAFPLIKGLPYNLWRAQNHEDSIRFYALRLHEAGMVRSSPKKLIADGNMDRRFLNELKKELKG